MGIAALAFASCAKDTVTEVNRGMAIDFRVAAQTRATETTTANLDEFKVTAIAVEDEQETEIYFDRQLFEVVEEKEGDVVKSRYFISDPVYYWPKGGTLKFYAYSPVDMNVKEEDGKTVEDFTPAPKVEDQVDFITARAIATHTTEIESTGVGLAFTHELTQIQVKATNSNEGYKYTIKAFEIGNVDGKGTFDFTKAVGSRWTLSNDKTTDYTVDFEEVVLNATPTVFLGETNSAMLLPQQLTAWTNTDEGDAGTYFAVLARIETAAGTVVYPKAAEEDNTNGVEGQAEGDDAGEGEVEEEKKFGWLAVGVDTKWEPGNKYVYTLDFSTGAGIPVEPGGNVSEGGNEELFGGPIKFTTEVAAWTTTNDITIKKEVTVPPVITPTNNPTGDQQ